MIPLPRREALINLVKHHESLHEIEPTLHTHNPEYFEVQTLHRKNRANPRPQAVREAEIRRENEVLVERITQIALSQPKQLKVSRVGVTLM